MTLDHDSRRTHSGPFMDFHPERTQPLSCRENSGTSQAIDTTYKGSCFGRSCRRAEIPAGEISLIFELVRLLPTKFTQPGDLFYEGEHQCHTLETGSIFTPGDYSLKNCYSHPMGMWLPGIFATSGTKDLLGFIHPGTPHVLAGRHVMLGYERRLDMIVDSRRAFQRIFELVDDARTKFDNEEVILRIKAR